MRYGLMLLIVMCAGCAQHNGKLSNAQQITAMMFGDFGTDANDKDGNFQDRRRALADLGEGTWVYLQLNSGPERHLYRQRVLQLIDQDADTVIQYTHSLKLDDDKRDLIADPARLASLSMDDLVPALSRGCDMVWRRAPADSGFEWRGEVSPAECVIYSKRRQREIGIGAESLLREDALWQTERGYDLDGSLLWGTPVGQFNKLGRTANPPL